MWRTPVTDRTLNDAEQIIALSKSIADVGWENASEFDKNCWLLGDVERLKVTQGYLLTKLGETLLTFSGTNKGAWNVSDANRIIDNSVYLRDMLNDSGYSVWFEQQPYYTQETLQYYSTLNTTMKANIRALVNAFYQLDNPYINDTNVPKYVGANAMEENLRITKLLLDSMISDYRLCGDTTSSQYILL